MESYKIRSILVPVDGSEHSLKAMTVAIEEAKLHGSSLHLIHVVQLPTYSAAVFPGVVIPAPMTREYIDSLKKNVDSWLKKWVEIAKSDGLEVKSTIIEDSRSVVQSIIEYADREGIDLIIIGTRGLSGFKRLLIGSVSSAVVEHANCNVMVVRR